MLVSLMVHGPDVEPTVRGLIRSVDGTGDSPAHFTVIRAEDDPDPVFAGAGTGDDGHSVLRVWRQGVLFGSRSSTVHPI